MIRESIFLKCKPLQSQLVIHKIIIFLSIRIVESLLETRFHRWIPAPKQSILTKDLWKERKIRKFSELETFSWRCFQDSNLFIRR